MAKSEDKKAGETLKRLTYDAMESRLKRKTFDKLGKSLDQTFILQISLYVSFFLWLFFPQLISLRILLSLSFLLWSISFKRYLKQLKKFILEDPFKRIPLFMGEDFLETI